MKYIADQQEISDIKERLMELLAAHDPQALKLIDRIKKIAVANEDGGLLGYAYYRYAYYYYFAQKDLQKFRGNLQLAIKHLLRNDDKEFLGGSYNLVAYDAQDMGYYDVAYAYFMIAVNTCEQVEGIALPSLIEASAGRLLLELGEHRQGRKQLRKALQKLKTFRTMHVYNYNMLVSYADEALALFLLKDKNGLRKTLENIEKHYSRANEAEVELSRIYYLLANVYRGLLENDEAVLAGHYKTLLSELKKLPFGELTGLIFELESLVGFMIDQGHIDKVNGLLKATELLAADDNLSVANRYYALMILYYEQTGNRAKLHKSLIIQHDIRKKIKIETVRTQRYAMEFSDMVENIAKEREKAQRDNAILQQQANTDPLTGLYNRNAMNTRLSEMFDEAREEGKTFGVGIIDVDRFKHFNDTYGHQAGDDCLRAIGCVMLSYAAGKDLFFARYGGDEFIVCCTGLCDGEMKKIAKELSDLVTKEASRSDCRVYISLGMYNAIPKVKQKFWDYLSLADRELYKTKGAK